MNLIKVRKIGTWAAALALANGSVITMSAAAESNRQSIRVDDAYVRQSADGSRWKIGTDAVEWTYEFKDGSLRLAGFENKTVSPPREYIANGSATTPFTVKHGDGAPWMLPACRRRPRDGLRHARGETRAWNCSAER